LSGKLSENDNALPKCKRLEFRNISTRTLYFKPSAWKFFHGFGYSEKETTGPKIQKSSAH